MKISTEESGGLYEVTTRKGLDLGLISDFYTKIFKLVNTQVRSQRINNVRADKETNILAKAEVF